MPVAEVQVTLVPAIAAGLDAVLAAQCSPALVTCASGLTSESCAGAQPATPGAARRRRRRSCRCSTATTTATQLAPDVASIGNGVPDGLSFGIAATAVGDDFQLLGD